VRHKSVNTPLSHERLVGTLQDGGRGTHVMHFVQLYPQPLYTASQVRTTCRSWDEGVLTDVCLTGVLTDLCLTLYYSCNVKDQFLKVCWRYVVELGHGGENTNFLWWTELEGLCETLQYIEQLMSGNFHCIDPDLMFVICGYGSSLPCDSHVLKL